MNARFLSPIPPLCAAFCVALMASHAWSQVLINEFQAAPSERILKWDEDGVPSVGSGIIWHDPDFDAEAWLEGDAPLGSNASGLNTDLSTDLTSEMEGKVHSLYLRKSFDADTAAAASSALLQLSIDYDDGFVAYLNGVEVARKNLGPEHHHIHAAQRAYNASEITDFSVIDLGLSNELLVDGDNLLAIQIHNFDLDSDLRVDASLHTEGEAEVFFDDGPAGGAWGYFIGIHEPSGIMTDPKLITDPFAAPAGKEEDYEDPQEARDWVELYNANATPYDLTGHSLTDNPTNPDKWIFPEGTVIPAHGYLVVLCDKREEANGATADYLHCSFGLSSEGGTIALHEGAALLDSVTYPDGQSPHYSYGRNPVGGGWVFLDTATPGTTNQGDVYLDKCTKPNPFEADGITEIEGGFYASSQTVLLITSTLDAEIRYTLDGSDPVETSTLYTGPLNFGAINNKTGTVLRARTFKDGWLPSKITTRTLLINQKDKIRTLPALVMTGDESRVWYDEAGILSIVGGSYDGSGKWNSDGPDSYNIPGLSGSPAERPIYVEFMHPDGSPGFRLHAGVRLSASSYTAARARYSRPHDSPWSPTQYEEKPSFNLFFRGIYGKSKLDYPLLDGYDVERFDHLRLRAGKNDIANPHIVDELCRRIFMEMGHEGSKGRWCTLYVNGSFKGYYNLCERIREPFLQEHFNSRVPWDVIENGEVESGSDDALQTLLDVDLQRDLTVEANYEAVRAKLDITNVCDYFLMKIYAAMWDWPNHNWCLVRERSSGPHSVFRFIDWDSEGGFNAIGFTNKNVDYDTIGLDLVPEDNALGIIFNRLSTSPEFRMAFADRIQKHFFNGGVLDDRASLNPNFWLKTTKDELKAEVSAIIKWVTGQGFSEGWFTTWTRESNGRRSHLFGAGDASFITHGYWPATLAASLSLPSGGVALNSSLEISASSGSIYYTTDGSDPRLFGGTLSPQAILYTGPITLTNNGSITVRVLDNGVWSPLTEGSYVIDPVEPAVGNLVIAELMYHGPPPTAAEAALGYDTDSFDYCRVMNVGTHTVSTAGLSFDGITCVLPTTHATVPYVEPGESFLVVRDLNAFRHRYGNAYDDQIAASYSKNFSNGGELVRLIYTPPSGGNAIDIVSFTYSDAAPWPTPPDRYGPSLLLVNPGTNPDPNLPESWEASSGVGGQPGGLPLSTSWDTWVGLAFPAAESEANKAPDADPDKDGLSNAIEYALGTSPQLRGDGPHRLPRLSWQNLGLESYLSLDCQTSRSASDAEVTIETSSSLEDGSWGNGPGHTVSPEDPTDESDGSQRFTVRDAVPLGTAEEPKRFIRLRVDLP